MTANATAAQPTWTQLYLPAATGCNPPTPVAALAVNPTDPKTVYVGLQGLGTGAHIYKSTDAGSTFTDITGNLPDVPINSIVIDPNTPTNIYVADDVGVFVASDGGQANEVWSRLGTGLPAAAVLQIALTGGSAPSIVAATHGRGAWVIPAQAPPNFTVSLSPASQTVNGGAPGGTATLQLTTTAVNGYPTSGTLTLACTVSAGSCGVSPATVTVGATTTLTVDTSHMDGGSQTVTIQATDGALTHGATVLIDIQGFSFFLSPSLGSTLPNLEAGGAAQPEGLSLQSLSGGFADPITVSCPSAPAGITCTPSASSYDLSQFGYVNGTLSVAASASTAPGAYTINVSASGGGLTQSTTFTVTVVDFTLALNPTLAHALRGVNSVTTTATVSTASGFTGAVTLGCSSTGSLTCAASPASISPGESAAITVSGLNSTTGFFSATLNVTAASGAQQVTQKLLVEVDDFSLTVLNGGAPVVVLPAIAAITLPGPGVYDAGQFSGPVAVTCAATPAPVTCAVSPSSISASPGQAVTITFGGLSGLAVGATLSSTITGSAQGITHQIAGPSLVISSVSLGPAQGQPGNPPAVGGSYRFTAPITLADNLTPLGTLNETTLQVTCGAPSLSQCQVGVDLPGIYGTLNLANYSGPDQITLQLALNATESGVTVSDQESVPLALADFSLAASTTTATVQPGQNAAYSLVAKAVNGWNGYTTFSCSGLPTGASCQFSSPGGAPQGGFQIQGASVPITLTIGDISTSAAAPPPSGPGRWPWLWVAALAAALAALVGAERRWRPAWRWAGAMTAAVFLLALVMAACGGGSVQTGNNKSALPPATTYTVTVTANSNFAAANASLTRTVQVSLTVQ
jgi:hypothetical protein